MESRKALLYLKKFLIHGFKAIKPQMKAVALAASLLSFLVVGAQFWQSQKNKQAIDNEEMAYFDQLADQLIKISAKGGFFEARFRGCHVLKITEVCDTFYPSKDKNRKINPNGNSVLAKIKKVSEWSNVPPMTQTFAVQLTNSLGATGREKIIQQLLNSDKCMPPMLIGALAFKLEEQFPDEAAVRKTLGIYKKGFSCQKGMDEKYYTDIVPYRLGLLATWLNQPELAEEAFEEMIAKSQSNLLLPRAKYWSNQARLAQKKDVRERLKIQNFQDHPISFHNLYDLTKDAEFESKPFDIIEGRTQPALRYSSEDKKLNTTAQLYLALKRKQALELAERTLQFIDLDQLELAEPGFQLFIATEMANYDDLKHERFKAFSNLFQEHPKYMTIENLKMFLPIDYAHLIVKNTQEEDPYLVFGLIRQESSFNAKTQSPVGARGLMQIMPMTAKELKRNIQLDQLLDPAINVQLGSKYIHALLREFDGDVMKALASYNAGAGNVRKWSRRYPVSDSLLFADLIPYEETREYVSNILRNRYWYEKIYPQHEVLAEAVAQKTDKSQSQ